MSLQNAVMKQALERAKKYAQENPSKKSLVKIDDSSIDENGVNLNVLSCGGSTRYKNWDVYVHLNGLDGKLPKGKWHFRDACGNRVFIKTNLRKVAQDFVNEYYGKNKYTVSASSTD